MITEKMKQIMQQIKEVDPDYKFITDEDGKKIETIYPVKRVDNSHVKRKSISFAQIGDDKND